MVNLLNEIIAIARQASDSSDGGYIQRLMWELHWMIAAGFQRNCLHQKPLFEASAALATSTVSALSLLEAATMVERPHLWLIVFWEPRLG